MKRKSKATIGPVEFIDRVIQRADENSEPLRLAAYQRRVLERVLRFCVMPRC